MTEGWLGQLERVWLVVMPRRLERFLPSIADAQLDGAWMLAWPGTAVLVPMLSLAIGVLAPARWPGYDISYLSSISYLALAVLISVANGGAGVMLFLGTLVGDVLFSRESAFALRSDPRLVGGSLLAPARQFAWFLVEYAVLGLLLVRAPQSARNLVEDLVRRAPPGWLNRFRWGVLLLRIVLFAAVFGLLVFFWTQAAVPLDRAVTVFIGLDMGALAPPLQRDGWRVLVIAAVVGGAARIALEDWAVRGSARAQAIVDVYRQRWSGTGNRGSLWAAVPEYVRMGLTAAGTLLLLAGIIDGLFEAAVACVATVAAQLIRYRLYQGAPRIVRATLQGVPSVVRLAGGIAVAYVLISRALIVLNQRVPTPGYRELLFSTLVVMLVFALLFPATRPTPEVQQARA
jgi:hypothetical protein